MTVPAYKWTVDSGQWTYEKDHARVLIYNFIYLKFSVSHYTVVPGIENLYVSSPFPGEFIFHSTGQLEKNP